MLFDGHAQEILVFQSCSAFRPMPESRQPAPSSERMMLVIRAPQARAPQTPRLIAVAAFSLALAFAAPLRAQNSNPSSASNPFYGSITLDAATDDTLTLSLADPH